MEFDKNGMVILSEKVLQEIDRLPLRKLPPIRRKLSEKYDDLLEFVHNYMENHGFVGLRMVSGLYITKYNPRNDFDSVQELQKAIKRRVSLIIDVYAKLGVCERYGKNAIKINREKMKEFSLNDIRNYAYKN